MAANKARFLILQFSQWQYITAPSLVDSSCRLGKISQKPVLFLLIILSCVHRDTKK